MKIKHALPAMAVVGTLLAGVLHSTPATAGTFTARISGILLYEDGNLVYVYPQGGVQSPPACHGSNGDYTSFSMSRPRAKEYLAALLMAHASGKTVSFRTAGACTDQPMSDTLLYFKIND
jgi:hypothetical protein